MKYIILFTLILTTFSIPGCSSSPATELTNVIQLESGPIRGTVLNDIETYLGIPYAAPPIGELRWKRPEGVSSWTKIRSVNQYGNACPQADTGIDYGTIDEDCLYLNVWVPKTRSSNQLPVMVWIHGGAFIAGSGSYSLYNGKYLAAKGVVVVTINYRLGPLGFLTYSGLSAESTNGLSGNYGILDQIAVLEWIQTNISAFGGDPDNVTIFGESAGSISVTTLMLSPLADGLFQRAIAESGTPILDQYYFVTSTGSMSDALESGAEFVSALGCAEDSNPVTCMRGKSTDELITTAMLGFKSYYIDQYPFFPTIDGWVIPDDPKTLFETGDFIDVPLIIGSNGDEASLFIEGVSTLSEYESWVELAFGNGATVVLERFPATSEDVYEVFDQVYTLALFRQPARFVVSSMENMESKAYLYELTRIPPTQTSRDYNAYHGLDISYVFGTLTAAEGFDSTDFDLSNDIMNYWINFATTGDPNGDGLTTWPEYGSSAENIDFGDSISTNTELDKADCDFFELLLLN